MGFIPNHPNLLPQGEGDLCNFYSPSKANDRHLKFNSLQKVGIMLRFLMRATSQCNETSGKYLFDRPDGRG